ncbi:hypothetical protein Pan258_43180 [Symmachiella dynata]|uniref:hypothetical protein n=1 Tax=Symmachiella dynata TaxID=2527995 RepID=UPI00118B6A38|nr:hypothetical protein [Symmachiella dynata]QDT50261.1 hypothetical protein Pan258_43180 [Symmachiella dynata]
MRYDANIPEMERQRLALLIGRQLMAVSTDRWAVQLATDTFDVLIIPEEIATPDDDHECADVTRPKLIEPVESEFETIASGLGTMTSLWILSTVVVFSPPRIGNSITSNDATIPEGIDYGPIFSHPLQPPSVNPAQAIVDLDIAFEIGTDTDQRIIVYTDGCGFFVYTAINEEPIAKEICERTKLRVA